MDDAAVATMMRLRLLRLLEAGSGGPVELTLYDGCVRSARARERQPR